MYNKNIMKNMADIHSFLYSQGQKLSKVDEDEKIIQQELDDIDDRNERAFDNAQQEK